LQLTVSDRASHEPLLGFEEDEVDDDKSDTLGCCSDEEGTATGQAFPNLKVSEEKNSPPSSTKMLS